MKWLLFCFIIFLSNAAAAEKKLVERSTLNQQVASIMSSLHLPGMGISTLTGKGDFTSKYLKQASADFIQKAEKMGSIKHPEKAFRVFNDEMLKALVPFQKAVASEEAKAITESWKVVMQTCDSCHSVYHAKQK